ncbi:maternal embryonic leucine zipper kinase [Tetranychus urticae]|uniref:non-specific serine/threonine protein kinase n=1 Tax=Tetranychus urticae TaxID=32264 RepID=T1JSV7_TETUR|nr:maternal embryonic leucine zipper kinase [Tetranychus urticae]
MENNKTNGKLNSLRINYQREDFDIEAGYYLHREKLGEGGFSKVRLATHLLTGQKVAIKCMDKTKLGEDLFRVKTEINALKTLDHQHIAKLLQVIETDQMIYLILEYCSGGELFDYIVSKNRLSEKESQVIMGCLVHCLAYLHSNGFAHRDLKPENILFDKNHKIKLIDFGLAAQSKDNPQSLQNLRTCCGSPAYAAPELISGNIYSGPAVDVWSAGVILYALLVGQLPFDDDNMGNLYKKIQAGKFNMPSWLSAEAKSLIQSMIQIDPKKRVTVKELLENPWIKDYLPNNSVEIQKNIFDEEVLWQVHKYFPTLSYTDLRSNIIRKFGYQTATYWLLKEKKLRGIKSPNANYPRNLAIATPPRSVIQTPTTPVTTILNTPTRKTPKVIVKAKADEIQVFKTPKLSTFKPNGSQDSKQSPAEYGSGYTTPNSKIPIYLKSGDKTCSPLSVAGNKTPNSTRKRKLFGDIVPGNDDNQNENSNAKENYATPPKRSVPSQTPKKSLLKKIIESATPSRKYPRNITSTAPTTTRNITMTKFSDPQMCIEKLMQALIQKGIDCKRKGFVLSCALNNKYHSMLTFNLEICQFGDKCALQRKRLKGDAWHYKKICEEILRISNEIYQC